VWVDGFTAQHDASAPLAADEFRFVAPSLVELHASAAGKPVKVNYDLGSEPIVSNFVVPKPTEVLGGIVELATGPAFQARCPSPACAGKDPIDLSASEGKAFEAYRQDPQANPAPDVTCERCDAKLPPETLAIATPAHGFRGGLRSTLGRTTLGFLAGLLFCLPLGVLSGAFPPIKRFIAPVEIAGGYAPPVALLPLFGAIAGQLGQGGLTPMIAEDTARIAFLFLIASLWLYPLVVKEIEAVDQTFVNTAYMLGASRGQVVKDVLVPVASAKIFDHVRASYAIGWASIILAEAFIGSRMQGQTGIGFFMNEMQRRHHMVNYFAAVLAIIATGIVIDWGFRLAGRRLFPWQEAA
jgi:NitT/TauT family transport system permease protein